MNAYWEDTVNITGHLRSGLDSSPINETVTIDIDGNSQNYGISIEGLYSRSYTIPSMGSHTITVSYAGSSTYAPTSATKTFVANKKRSILTTSLDKTSLSYGETVHISGSLNDNMYSLEGKTVTISINGEEHNVVTNVMGVFSYDYVTSAAGEYTVVTSFAGDTNHVAAEDTKYFTVSKISPSILLTAPDITDAETQTITVTLPMDATGTVNMVVTGKGTYSGRTVTSGVATGPELSGFSVGTYPVSVTYSGDAKYNSVSTSGSFDVTSSVLGTYLNLNSISSVIVGQNASITGTLTDSHLDPVSGATISISVKGEVVGSAVTNGSGVFSYSYTTSTTGTHSVSATFAGDAYHTISNDMSSFEVGKIGTYLQLDSISNVTIGSNAIITG